MSIVSIFDPRRNVTRRLAVTFIPKLKSLSARMSYVRGKGGGERVGDGEAGGGGVMCAFVQGVREFDIDAQEIVSRRNLFWP